MNIVLKFQGVALAVVLAAGGAWAFDAEKGLERARAAAVSGCRSSEAVAPSRGPAVSNWWKGMLHSHTCWSDGSAFPEQAIEWYRSRGYHFYAMSDHNVFAADVDHWLTVSAKDGKYPPLNPMQINYRHGFPDPKMVAAYRRDWKPEERLSRDGNWSEIRLKTYAECARLFNEKGKFLLVPAVEASHSVAYADGLSHQVHCNYMGVPDLLPLHRQQNWGWTGHDVPLSEYIEALAAAYEMSADDLYVRARIESPTERPHALCSLHPKCRVAWTQPYAR